MRNMARTVQSFVCVCVYFYPNSFTLIMNATMRRFSTIRVISSCYSVMFAASKNLFVGNLRGGTIEGVRITMLH